MHMGDHGKKVFPVTHTGCRTGATNVNSFIAQTDYFIARATYMSHCTALMKDIGTFGKQILTSVMN